MKRSALRWSSSASSARTSRGSRVAKSAISPRLLNRCPRRRESGWLRGRNRSWMIHSGSAGRSPAVRTPTFSGRRAFFGCWASSSSDPPSRFAPGTCRASGDCRYAADRPGSRSCRHSSPTRATSFDCSRAAQCRAFWGTIGIEHSSPRFLVLTGMTPSFPISSRWCHDSSRFRQRGSAERTNCSGSACPTGVVRRSHWRWRHWSSAAAMSFHPTTAGSSRRSWPTSQDASPLIDACGIPDTIVHGDFWPGNVRGDAGSLVLLDWGDCGVGHPMLDMSAFLDRIPSGAVDRVRSQWLDDWRTAVPGSDPDRAAALLAPVASSRLGADLPGLPRRDRVERAAVPPRRPDGMAGADGHPRPRRPCTADSPSGGSGVG